MDFYELAEQSLRLERAGRRLIRLNVGNTNLPTPDCAREAAARKLREGSSGYGPAGGLPELREKIAAREGCAAGNIVIGPGSKHLLYGLLAVLRPGPVAIPSPRYPAYERLCRMLGREWRSLESKPEDRWEFNETRIEDASVVVICNPLNPTSTVYSDALMRRVLKHRATVIVDEAYRGLAFEPLPTYDAIRVRSFSKEFCMENWRLGYAVVPPEVARRLEEFLLLTITCVPEFVQAAGMACLDAEEEILSEHRSIWRARAAPACAALRKKGWQFAEPDAGMYVFASHPAMADSEAFCASMLTRDVVVAPGMSFGGYRGHVRLCLNQPEAVLEDAIGRMSDALARP